MTTQRMESDMEFIDDPENTGTEVTSLTYPRYAIYYSEGNETYDDGYDAYHENECGTDAYADTAGYGTFTEAKQWCIDHAAANA